MAIVKYKEGVKIKVGQFVCCEGLLIGAFAGHPRKVVEVKPKSVVAVRCREGETPAVKMLKSVQFVCDTEEEAAALHDASVKFYSHHREREDELHRELGNEERAIVQALVERFNATNSLP